MKTLKTQLLLATALALVLPLLVWAAVIVDDRFADGNSQNQDLEHNSLRVFNGRNGTIRTDAVGSVTFDVTAAGGSDGFWAFFTDVEHPVKLNVGDKLTVAGTFSLQGFQQNGQDMRFGVFDSLGTRTTQNPTGGMNHATFVGDPGYNVQFYASGEGTPFKIGRRTVFASTGILNTAADFTAITTEASGATERQTLSEDTPYTLTYTIERLTDIDTRISVAVTGGKLENLNYSVVETASLPDIPPNTSFDYFGFRIGGANFATRITFTRLFVEYTPPPSPSSS